MSSAAGQPSGPSTGSSPRYAADRPFPRGYTAPPQERRAVADAHTTRLWWSTAAAVVDHAVIAAVVMGCAWPVLWTGRHLVAGLAAAGCGAVLLGRQFRALECLAHEASHFNWARDHRRLNDLLATVLACVPTGSRLAVYRASHLRHHGRFGTRDDPDLANYRRFALEELDRTSVRAFARDALSRMPAYRRRWRETSGGPGRLPVLPFGWAVLLAIAPAGIVWGSWSAAFAAAGVWLLGYGVLLPVVRFLGECNEHVYTGSQTVFDATVSNLGLLQRLLIHPHGDGYHTVHHLWPGVPHHRIRNLHRRLTANDPEGYTARLRHRTKFLSSPVRGLRPKGRTSR
ncbi:fatty acid desaturase family protein [Streptomyces sp. NPDC058464]|uniref:fatty acid desaturase family protein n=1 Tax=Streptomyces sp. NPDC058464 TaxID=3346511 RepID=UPI003662DEC0